MAWRATRHVGLAALVAFASIAAGSAIQACGIDIAGSFVAPAEADASNTLGDAAIGLPDATQADAACPPVATVIPDSGDRLVFAVLRNAAIPSDAATDAAGPWRGCTSFVLDRSTAALEVTDDGGVVQATARVAIEWDVTALYVAIDIEDGVLEGVQAAPADNDSIEIYASSDSPMRNGDYLASDHHYIVDYRGLSLDYSNVNSPVPFDAATTARTPTGYRVEIRIDASVLGGPLVVGQRLFFDALLNDGVNQRKYLVWAMNPHADSGCAGCTSCACNVSPAYDTLLFAPFTLVP